MYFRGRKASRVTRMSKSGLLVVGTMWMLIAPTVPLFAEPAGASAAADPLHQFSTSISTLITRVSPSVVQVLVTGYGAVDDNNNEADLVVGKRRSLASGVIIDPDGYIVTNAHVVTGSRGSGGRPRAGPDRHADPIARRRTRPHGGRACRRRFAGGRSRAPEDRDDGLPALRLANYDALRQGEVVFAVGSPQGLRNSVRGDRERCRAAAGRRSSDGASRPTRRSITATAAARSSTSTASWSGSIPTSFPSRAAARARFCDSERGRGRRITSCARLASSIKVRSAPTCRRSRPTSRVGFSSSRTGA